jgi:hypothetical protein
LKLTATEIFDVGSEWKARVSYRFADGALTRTRRGSMIFTGLPERSRGGESRIYKDNNKANGESSQDQSVARHLVSNGCGKACPTRFRH